jgi:hypothetical protein
VKLEADYYLHPHCTKKENLNVFTVGCSRTSKASYKKIKEYFKNL